MWAHLFEAAFLAVSRRATGVRQALGGGRAIIDCEATLRGMIACDLDIRCRRIGADPSTTTGQAYTGYWRVGGDVLVVPDEFARVRVERQRRVHVEVLRVEGAPRDRGPR